MYKYQKQLKDLSFDELRLFKLLEGLDLTERITGDLIMSRMGIESKRKLYSLVENVRQKGFPIIGGKRIDNQGYKLARSKEELQSYLKSCQTSINTQIRTMEAMKRFSEELFNEKDDIA